MVEALPAGMAVGSGRWLQIRPATASAEIVAQIRQKLFDGLLKPGDFLGTERGLCAAFGIARLTMRDALRVLEASGIVEVKVGKAGGVRVAQPRPDRFADALAIQLMLAGITRTEIFDAQMGVEARAAELAAQHAGDDDFATMEVQLRLAESHTDDPVAFVRYSLGFHAALVEASHNRALIAQFQALRHLSWGLLVQDTSPARAKSVVRTHSKVLDALRARDGEAAARLVCAHLKRIIDAFVRN